MHTHTPMHATSAHTHAHTCAHTRAHTPAHTCAHTHAHTHTPLYFTHKNMPCCYKSLFSFVLPYILSLHYTACFVVLFLLHRSCYRNSRIPKKTKLQSIKQQQESLSGYQTIVIRFIRCYCLYIVHTRTSPGVAGLCFPCVSFTSFTTLTLPGLMSCTCSTGRGAGCPVSPRRPNYEAK